MYSRWYNIAVVALWLSAMTWLVVEKVLPPMLVGEPPSYETILKSQKKDPRVGWRMSLNDKRLGWAVSEFEQLNNELTEVRSRVHFDRLPLKELASGVFRFVLNRIELPVEDIQLEATSRMNIDALGRLHDFESAVKIDPRTAAVRFRGRVDGTKLYVTATSQGSASYSGELDLPRNALVTDSLSPQTQLPGLRKGQTWNVPVYNPLRLPTDAMEVLQATVEEKRSINWGGGRVKVWLVVYRRDSGYGLGSTDKTLGRLWVRPDGAVLKQEMTLLDSTMTFERMTDEEAAESECFAQQDATTMP